MNAKICPVKGQFSRGSCNGCKSGRLSESKVDIIFDYNKVVEIELLSGGAYV